MSFDWRAQPDDEIERHFNPRVAVPDAADKLARFAAESEAARARVDGQLDIRYGERPKETLDIFPAGDGAPVQFFVHGGFWRLLDKSDHSFLAPPMVAAGVTHVSVNYDLCPDVTLDIIVEEVRAALAWTAANIANHGGDPERIYVAGHSAGAHLAAMLLNDAASLPLIRGAACLSGIYEPEVVMHTSVNADVRLDRAMAVRNDCVRQPPLQSLPLLIAAGGAEPEGWQQQSRAYAAACAANGATADYLTVEGADHFTLLLDAADGNAQLTRAMLAQINAG